MSIVVRGLPVLVEVGDDSRPVAFWWQHRRHAIDEYICLWDDAYTSTAHWLVQVRGEPPVSLVNDRAASEWLVEWIESWPSMPHLSS
jgi:hypothetical protein